MAVFSPVDTISFSKRIHAYIHTHTQEVAETRNTPAPLAMIKLIMSQVYNTVIEDPSRLNDYKGFSEEVH